MLRWNRSGGSQTPLACGVASATKCIVAHQKQIHKTLFQDESALCKTILAEPDMDLIQCILCHKTVSGQLEATLGTPRACLGTQKPWFIKDAFHGRQWHFFRSQGTQGRPFARPGTCQRGNQICVNKSNGEPDFKKRPASIGWRRLGVKKACVLLLSVHHVCSAIYRTHSNSSNATKKNHNITL